MKPRTLRGITFHSVQTEISLRRFPDIQFINADAVEYVASLPTASVDRILVLDCVYHFPSRQRFLDECARILRPDGKLAMTDLIQGDRVTAFQHFLMRIIFLLTDVPFSNFMKKKDYLQSFAKAGFTGVSIEDISEDVFPGLSLFMHRHRGEMGQFGIDGRWTGFLLFARILRWWSATKVARFIVIHT
jgi:SAM-dependent methyltransferase